MMPPFDTALLKHPSAAHRPPTAPEREANRTRRAARRAAFWAFVEKVFSHPPRHPSHEARSAKDTARIGGR